MLQQLIKPLFFSSFGVFLLWFLHSLKYRKERENKTLSILLLLFSIYIAWVLCVVLYPIPTTLVKRNDGINIVPITHMIQDYNGAFVMPGNPIRKQFFENYLGNIILFIPFGFLSPLITRYKTFGKIVVAAALFSAAIETLQFFTRYIGVYRSVDIDDVLLNTTGAILGYLVFMLTRNFVIKPATA